MSQPVAGEQGASRRFSPGGGGTLGWGWTYDGGAASATLTADKNDDLMRSM